MEGRTKRGMLVNLRLVALGKGRRGLGHEPHLDNVDGAPGLHAIGRAPSCTQVSSREALDVAQVRAELAPRRFCIQRAGQGWVWDSGQALVGQEPSRQASVKDTIRQRGPFASIHADTEHAALVAHRNSSLELTDSRIVALYVQGFEVSVGTSTKDVTRTTVSSVAQWAGAT